MYGCYKFYCCQWLFWVYVDVGVVDEVVWGIVFGLVGVGVIEDGFVVVG